MVNNSRGNVHLFCFSFFLSSSLPFLIQPHSHPRIEKQLKEIFESGLMIFFVSNGVLDGICRQCGKNLELEVLSLGSCVISLENVCSQEIPGMDGTFQQTSHFESEHEKKNTWTCVLEFILSITLLKNICIKWLKPHSPWGFFIQWPWWPTFYSFWAIKLKLSTLVVGKVE